MMLCWTIKKKELESKQYNTSGLHSFINRYADTGFKTKWCGIWTPPIKIIEYYAYKINGTWLTGKNSSGCTIKPWGTKHHHTTDEFDITETVYAPDDYPAIISILSLKNKTCSKKTVTLELETAINIRTKQENIHERKYTTGFNELRNSIMIESSIGRAIIGIGKTEKHMKITNEFTETYKNHNPGSPQACFIPSTYSISLEIDIGEEVKLPFIYCGTTKDKDTLINTYDRCMHDWSTFLSSKIKTTTTRYHHHDIKTPQNRLDKTYLWAQYSLLGLLNKSDLGMGIFAGYPWFLEFWGRDVFWSLLGLIDMGEFKTAREIFVTMANQQDKKMPCIIHLNRTKEYHGRDVDPLFLIALDDYEKKSGDQTLRKELNDNIKKILKNLELIDYIVSHKPDETWMDSIERNGHATDIQALWIEALKPIEPKLSMKMNKRLNQNFWNTHKKFYYDTYSKLSDPKVTANALIPLFFGLTDNTKAESVLKTTKKELISLYGIRTQSKQSNDYNPSGYHTGSSWGLTTGWGAVAFLRYGWITEGLKCLDDFAYDCNKFQPGALSEVLDSETGNILGTPDQAWSSSLYIYAIDDFLFGIRPNMQKKTIVIEPRIFDHWGHMYRNGKNIGTYTFDLKIERTSTGLDINIEFKQEPKDMICELILPKWIDCIHHNNKKINKRTLKFKLQKENIITGHEKESDR